MARTELSSQDIVRAGLQASYTAVIADGHKFLNGGREIIHIINSNASTIVLTIMTPMTVDSLDVAERTISIPTTEERFVGPFQSNVYNQPADRMVYIDYDIQASVTVAILTLPPI